MPIVTAEDIPSATRRIALESLQALHAAKGPSLLALRSVPVEALEALAQHPIFTLSAADVATGRLSEARPTGYRYLLAEGPQILGAAEVAVRAGGGLRFAQFQQGRAIDGIADAISAAESLPEVSAAGASTFELRVLRMPTLLVSAVWLRARSGEADLLFVLPPVPAGFEAAEGLRPAEFFARLKQRAERMTVVVETQPRTAHTHPLGWSPVEAKKSPPARVLVERVEASVAFAPRLPKVTPARDRYAPAAAGKRPAAAKSGKASSAHKSASGAAKSKAGERKGSKGGKGTRRGR